MFIWVLLLTVISTVESISVSTTSGGTPVWRKLWAAYSTIPRINNATFDLRVSGAASGMLLLNEGSVTSISSTDIDIISNTAELLGMKFITLPLFFQPYTFIFNIPEIGVNRLIFDWNLISEMYLGNIKYWNDSRLVELNPLLANVNKPITHVLRSANNSATDFLSTIFSNISSEWNQKYGVVLSWPDLNVPTIQTTTNVFATFAKVISNLYSISYGTFPFFYSIGFDVGVNYAGFKTPDGIVYPSQTNLILESIENSDWHIGDVMVTGIDIDENWPFILPGYVFLPDSENPNISCDDYFDNLMLLRWIYTDKRAKKVIESEGYYLPSPAQIQEIMNYLDTLTCNKEILLKVTLVPSTTQIGKWILTIGFWIMILSSMMMFSAMKFKKTISKIYAVIVVIGELLCGGAMILWSISPTSYWTCIGRWWLMGFGLVIFSGGVFCRSYQLKKIHELVKLGRYQSAKYIDHIKLLATLMGIITLFELIILIFLQIYTPFKSEIYVLDTFNLLGEYQCTSKNIKLWIYLQSSYLYCILILGVYIIYSTWSISSSVDDTRINILMFFGCLITITVADVIWGNSKNGDELDTWWALSMIVIWGLCMMCSVFIPKAVKAVSSYDSSKTDKSSDKSSDKSKSNNTNTTSTAKNTFSI